MWHPCTADQGTAGAFLSRTERAELKRAPRFCVLWAFLYLSTLPSYMCFTAVYCTCTRGPVRNRNRTRVLARSLNFVGFEPTVPVLSSRTCWIRTRGSTVRGGNPLGLLEPFALLISATNACQQARQQAAAPAANDGGDEGYDRDTDLMKMRERRQPIAGRLRLTVPVRRSGCSQQRRSE